MRTRPLLLPVFLPILTAFSLAAEPEKAVAEKTDALALALMSNNWSWENVDAGKRSVEEIQFYQGGIAENPRFFSCKWEITSPRTVMLQNTRTAYLVFDADFTHYIGFDFNGKTLVEGYRREWLDPKRPAPEPREPAGK
jgi:hypothetical protein